MLYYLVIVLYVLVCLFLIGVILLQQGKGGDIANAFGGGSSQAVFGARSGATLLTRATSVLAALFVVLSMVLTAWGQRGGSSVVGGIDAPAPVATPPVTPAPTTPAPVTGTTVTPAPQPATPPADGTPPPASSAPPPVPKQ